VIVHLRLRTIVPRGESATPGTYCGCRHVPRGLSAPQIKEAHTIAETLGIEVCPSCLEAKADEDRLH
jgi:hypothetical protein